MVTHLVLLGLLSQRCDIQCLCDGKLAGDCIFMDIRMLYLTCILVFLATSCKVLTSNLPLDAMFCFPRSTY